MSLTREQIEELEATVAVMTGQGWSIPNWLADIRRSLGLPVTTLTHYVIHWS